MPAAYSGTIPADANPDPSQLFAGLLEFKWREVGFPVVRFSTELRQDLAIHKFADKDGAHVEGTGRAPLQITARIAFLNGLDQGPNEHWQRPLYPYTWRKFFEACADKTSGSLQHPELGPITCKCEMARTDWEANVRGGVYVDAVWIESDDTQDSLTNALTTQSPVANVAAYANDLDNYMLSGDTADTAPQFPPVLPYSFSDLANGIRGTIDTYTLMQKQFGGRIQNIIYEANAIEYSLNQAANSNSLNWPIVQAAEAIKDAAYAAQKQLLSRGRPVGLYTVKADATLSAISQAIPAPIVDLMNLNVSLVQSPVITAGSTVRYYTG